jgi:hypothetical protein
MKNHRTKNPILSQTLPIYLGLALLAGSCSANQSEADDKKQHKLAVAPNQPTAAPMPATKPQIPLSAMKKMNKTKQILFAREDIAQRLGLELDKVSLSGATPVMRRSGALGCPKPDMQYTQALRRAY